MGALVLAVTLPLALRNSALVFLKPHAATDTIESFVRDHLSAAGIDIVDSGIKCAAEIADQKLIDQHYGSLARIAMEDQPADLLLSDSSKETFASTFGLDWSDALPSVLRNDEAMSRLNVDGLALEPMWRGGLQCKLAPGTYVSRLDGPDEPVYTLNGFYPAMRHSYVSPGAEVRWLVCEFDEAALSWRAFRREIIGATNPAEASVGSCRAELLARWEALGLPAAPTLAQNGVHASAGPLEGLKEKLVWVGSTLDTDGFARALLGEAHVSRETLDGWLCDNPVVTLAGETDKIFDLTEECGTDQVLAQCAAEHSSVAPDGPYEYAPAQVVY